MKAFRCFGILGLFLLFGVLLQTGCFNKNNPASISKVTPGISNSANLNFQILIPEKEKAQNLRQANVSSSAESTVEFQLKIINKGNIANPCSIITKKVTVVDGCASVSFRALPLKPVVSRLKIINGKIDGHSEFHGAIDLQTGTNTVEIAPVGSRLFPDVIAQTVESIIASPTLIHSSSEYLVSEVSFTILTMPLDDPDVYDKAFDNFSSQYIPHSISYNGNGQTSGTEPIDNGSYDVGSSIIIQKNTGNLAKTGYKFLCWNTQPDGSGTHYEPGAKLIMSNSNITLYAQWIADTILHISFDLQMQKQIYIANQPIKLAPLVTGEVDRVEFSANYTNIGESTSAPWTIEWKPLVGYNSITAIAYGKNGEQVQTQTFIYAKKGLLIPEPAGKDVILIATWWGAGLTDYGDFNFIASFTATDNVNKTSSANIRLAKRLSKKAKPAVSYGLPLDLRLKERAQVPQKKESNLRGSVRTNLANDSIMSVHQFYTLINNSFLSVDFFKMSQNDECIIYAMKNSINQPCISTTQAESAANAFGISNPYNPSGESIAQCSRNTFGHEWQANGGRDGESRIVILVFDEDLCQSNCWGYYRLTDENYPQGTNDSNGGEFLYISKNGFANQAFMACSTLSHEFQHMIQDNMGRIRDGEFSGTESIIFFDEGCAVLSEEINGFGLNATNGSSESFVNRVRDGLDYLWDVPVASWNGTYSDYGRAYLFARYLKQRIGENSFKQLIESSATKLKIEASLPGGIKEFFTDWTMAMTLTGKSGNIPDHLRYDGLDFYKAYDTRENVQIKLYGPLIVDMELSETISQMMACAKGGSSYAKINAGKLSNWSGKILVDLKQTGVTIQAVELQNDLVTNIYSPSSLSSTN